MKCKEVNSNFINAVEKSLGTEEQSAFEMHLISCKSCSKSYQRFRNVYQSINTEVEEFTPNPFLAQKVWEKATAITNTVKTPIVPFRRSAIVSIAAAGVAMGIVIGTLLSSSSQSTVNTKSEYYLQLADDYFPSNLYSPYEELENNN
jgi:anti-sigma factor RsiW